MTLTIKAEFNVPSTMRDGTILRANTFRPDAEGTFPVALNRTPYGKDFATSTPTLDAVRLAREGYIVVIQDVRGRFSSDGQWLPLRNEGQDGYDTVEWASSLPQSSGDVGMFGGSYTGFTQWAAAIEGPPHLKAIVPSVTWADAGDGVFWRGGALELGLGITWELHALAFDEIIRRYRGASPMELAVAIFTLAKEIDRLAKGGYRSLPLNQFEPLTKLNLGSQFFELISLAGDRASIGEYSVSASYDRVQVPALNVGGWYDIFSQGTLQNFSRLQKDGINPAVRQSRLLMGPWSHLQQSHVIGEMDFGFASQMQLINLQTDLTALTQRWFDYWLKGIANGVVAGPPVKLFIMGDNVWRDESEWPLARARESRYYLHEQGRLTLEMPGVERADRYDYDPTDPAPTSGGALMMNQLYAPGVKDQRAVLTRKDVLIYATEPLERDIEVTGPILVKLWAMSDVPDTDFVARLIDVHPDGFAQNLTDGIIRARYRGGDKPQFLEPSKPYEFTIDLWSTANVFKKNHRIRLDVTSSNFPRWDRNLNTGLPFGTDVEACVAHQTILHDTAHPSHVVLPVIPR